MNPLMLGEISQTAILALALSSLYPFLTHSSLDKQVSLNAGRWENIQLLSQ